MKNISEKLIIIRKDLSNKRKEVTELYLEQEEFWSKLVSEINNNKAYIRKLEGLSGFIKCSPYIEGSERIVLDFEKQSNPSAKALSYFEDETGLSFYKSNESSYVFNLKG